MPRNDADNPYQKKPHRAELAAKKDPNARFRSARWNPRLRRMQTIEEDADGSPTALLCADGARRMAGRTGKEGAYVEACRQVEIAVVPVVVPHEPKPRQKATPREQVAENARVEAIARNRVEAIMGGMSEDMSDWIGYEEAAKKHGRATVDACEKTFSAKIGAR
jgi:hypothetical protein